MLIVSTFWTLLAEAYPNFWAEEFCDLIPRMKAVVIMNRDLFFFLERDLIAWDMSLRMPP